MERCQGAGCTSFAQIATPTATTYSDTGLAAGSYSYRVRATDAAGNLSPYSNVASATIPDTQPPTAPSESDGDGEREPDQSELDGIDGQRRGDGILDGALPGRGLYEFCADRDTGWDNVQRHGFGGSTSYSYRVRATDAAGNLSRLLQHGECHDHEYLDAHSSDESGSHPRRPRPDRSCRAGLHQFNIS